GTADPKGAKAFSLTGQSPLLLHLPHYFAHPVGTDTRTRGENFGESKGLREPLNGPSHQRGLGPFCLGHLADPGLEFRVGLLQNPKEKIDEGPGIVPPFVPPLGRLVYRLVVALLVFLDEAFKTDVATCLDPR